MVPEFMLLPAAAAITDALRRGQLLQQEDVCAQALAIVSSCEHRSAFLSKAAAVTHGLMSGTSWLLEQADTSAFAELSSVDLL